MQRPPRHLTLGKTIGKGSYATVKQAKDRNTGMVCAVKIIDKRSSLFKPAALEKEINAMLKISHPNIVRLHGVYHERSKTYLILDLMTGGTVMDRIIEMDHFQERDAIVMISDVLSAVAYLHSIGIAHRDIKPENLLYASSTPESPDYYTIKLADFGLSSTTTEQSSMKTLCGTPTYVAPEIIDPKRKSIYYGPEVDIWSIGIVMYVMLCGFPPFFDHKTSVLFEQICQGKYDFPSPYWDGVSSEAKDLISKMLVVNPSERYSARQCQQHPWIVESPEDSEGPGLGSLHGSHRAFLLIRKLPLFANIDPMLLERITRKLKLVKVAKGDTLINAGDEGDSMYFINSGAMEILVDGERVDRLTTGDFFGEVALTVAELRTADVVSLGQDATGKCSTEPAELFQLMRVDFEEIMGEFPPLMRRLAHVGKVGRCLVALFSSDVLRVQARVRRASSQSRSPERRSPMQSEVTQKYLTDEDSRNSDGSSSANSPLATTTSRPNEHRDQVDGGVVGMGGRGGPQKGTLQVRGKKGAEE
eukprot:768743-Hanusia_phi.AAC.7